MYEIVLTPEAVEDLRSFRKHERKLIFDAIETHLTHQPVAPTRNQKRLRPNGLAEWELRIGKFRVFFDILELENQVKIEAVGYKTGSLLVVRGKEYRL